MIYQIAMIASLLALSLSLSLASAAIDNATVQYYANIHNRMIDNAPYFIKSLAGNETIDFNITRNNGSLFRTGLEMKNAHVSKIDGGGISAPSVSINASEDAVDEVVRSDGPVVAFLKEINSGRITVRMHHVLNGDKCGHSSVLPPFLRGLTDR